MFELPDMTLCNEQLYKISVTEVEKWGVVSSSDRFIPHYLSHTNLGGTKIDLDIAVINRKNQTGVPHYLKQSLYSRQPNFNLCVLRGDVETLHFDSQ